MNRIERYKQGFHCIAEEIAYLRGEAMSLPIGNRWKIFLKIVDLIKLRDE